MKTLMTGWEYNRCRRLNKKAVTHKSVQDFCVKQKEYGEHFVK